MNTQALGVFEASLFLLEFVADQIRKNKTEALFGNTLTNYSGDVDMLIEMLEKVKKLY